MFGKTKTYIVLGILGLAAAGCGGGGGGGGETTPPPPPPPPPPSNFSIGGTVSGLNGNGLILQNNGADDLSVVANGGFTFATEVSSGSAYAVTVQTQPGTPAQTCTVANGSGTAAADVTNVTLSCSDDPVAIDSDQDGLSDAQEAAIGTSPQLKDTDGDGLEDGREVNTGGFNPLIADLPTVEIDVIGAPSISINTVQSGTMTAGTTFSATFEQGQSSSYSRSDTEATSSTVSESERIYAEVEVSASPTSIGGTARAGAESTVSSSVTDERSTTIDSTSATDSRQEHGQLQSFTADNAFVTNGGTLRTTINLKNTSDLSYDLARVEVIASRRSGRTGSIQPIGTLTFEVPVDQQAMPTDAEIQKIVDQEFSNADELAALMADPSGLMFTVASFDMNNIGNEEERDWSIVSQDVNAQTAQVVIDYGDNQTLGDSSVERYQVATNVARDPVTNEVIGIPMSQVMSNSLEIPYTTESQEIVDENQMATGQFREVVTGVRSLATQSLSSGFWYVFTSSESANDPAVNFDDIVLMPGDRISMVYMRDSDGDEVFDREEYLLGTDPLEPDTDGDNLTDFEEARAGWVVVVNDESTEVFSDPLNVDSDGDTWLDDMERAMGTNPDNADTDGDSLPDNTDPNPTGANNVSFNATFEGPTKTVLSDISVSASGGRIVTGVQVNWGDGSPDSTKSCQAACESTLSFAPLHSYAVDGSYSVVVTADVENEASESRSYTISIDPRFKQDIGMSIASDWNELDDTRIIIDVNGDGMDDIVGFGPDGTYLSLSTGTGFGTAVKLFDDFATGASYDKNVQRRMLANVAGNDAPEIVEFGADGVRIALNDGGGNFSVLCNGDPCTSDYGVDHGYLNFDRHPRYLEDMNDDDLMDVVAFSDGGVKIGLSTGTGFVDANPDSFAIVSYGPASGGWVENTPRVLADLNGDGYKDIVGLGNNFAVVSMNNQDNTFTFVNSIDSLMTADAGYFIDRHLRIPADIDNDGLDDMIAFANAGVFTSLANNAGSLTPGSLDTLSNQFGYSDGWRIPNDQRYLVDINGDGLLDIVGFGPLTEFGSGGTYYDLNTGNGDQFVGVQLWVEEFSTGLGWTFDDNPRYIGDVNGDGRGDIIAFGDTELEVVFSLSATEN